MNEQVKSLLLILLTVAVVVAVIIVGFILVIHIKTVIRQKKVQGYGRRSEERIDALLKKAFGDSAVFSGIYLPYLSSNSGKHAEIDHIVVIRGGVFMIEVKSHNGYIRCPDDRYWWQTYNDKKLQFYNPLRQNATHVKILQELLKSEGQYNVPVYNLVVFTSSRVSFSQHHDNLVRTPELVGYIKRVGKKNTLSTSQTSRVRSILRHRAVKADSAAGRSITRRHRSQMNRGDSKNQPSGKNKK